MTSRRLAWRSFSVEVQVPDQLAGRLRPLLRRGPSAATAGEAPGALSVHQPPPVTPLRRDAQASLGFMRDPALAGDGRSPNPAVAAALAADAERQAGATTLAEQVALVPWYQTLELPGGIVTPGLYDHRDLVEHLGIPDDLSGCRVLDVATFDGFWAFELERRGAEVVALDLPSTGRLDFPPAVEAVVRNEGLDQPMGRPFALACEALGSEVTRLDGSVYELDPAAHGTFDLVFCSALLLHLRCPLEALRRMRSVAADRLILAERYAPDLSGRGDTLVRYEGGWDSIHWWAPSLEALVQMVVDCDFSDVRVHGGFRQAPAVEGGGPGWWRAVIHGRAGR